MELGLEFVAIVGANSMYPKRELGNHIIHKINGICLSVAPVDLEGANPSSVINGCILETTDRIHRWLTKPRWRCIFHGGIMNQTESSLNQPPNCITNWDHVIYTVVDRTPRL